MYVNDNAGNSSIMKSRLRRLEYFKWFACHSADWFSEVAASDTRHSYMAGLYGFNVAPKGRDGGIDDRTVEVFYGQRPFEGVKELVAQEDGLPSLRRRLLIERGASLTYQRGDNGAVIVTLAPAITENFRPQESTIVLEFMADPSPLRAPPWLVVPPRIERHWRCLMSYLQCTSIDGDPTLGDRIRLGWLRWTKPLIIEEKLITPRWRTFAVQIIAWVLTVGLSGTVLFGLQWLFRDALK
ncbi:hypothetical protein [Rhizobium sp. C104]|uniref:hypothetical protein n=1 Tax=Rhizobium TaxID=379 RepID=UPI001EF8C0BA|nr:hypothetical protein [Rhizobium sp. C104]ULJ77362.1 hypothetical protein MF410_15050 [Rhizobium sp. C104]